MKGAQRNAAEPNEETQASVVGRGIMTVGRVIWSEQSGL